MTQLYTNSLNMPLSLAVYLATDHYDHAAVGAGLSATTLLKPIKQVILGKRATGAEGIPDVAGMISSRIGTSIHSGIKEAWLTNHEVALRSLGYPEAIIKKVVVNPAPGTDLTGKIPVYLEVRTSREVCGISVSGEFDFVAEGKLEDHKSTTVYSYIMGNKDADYILQGSIYRWLNPTLITGDHIGINFIFMDWASGQAKQQPDKYPQQRMLQKKYLLLSLQETEAYVVDRVTTLLHLWKAPEELLPPCTDKELWRSEPQYKYYKKPENANNGSRSTKNFETLVEANAHYHKDGAIGLVKTVPGEVKACKYCPGFGLCTQKDALIASGDLIV
jgi:hypothetical protein